MTFLIRRHRRRVYRTWRFLSEAGTTRLYVVLALALFFSAIICERQAREAEERERVAAIARTMGTYR